MQARNQPRARACPSSWDVKSRSRNLSWMRTVFFRKVPRAICIEGPPQRQCYTSPQDFGRDPDVTLVQIEKTMPALLFSAASGGVSGFGVHFALLRPGAGKSLENLFLSDL